MAMAMAMSMKKLGFATEALSIGLCNRRGFALGTVPSVRDIGEVEKIIEYKFSNLSLLEKAFTHSSFKDTCASYEVLKFLGGSVLKLLITKHLCFKYPHLSEESLILLRTANFDTKKLAHVAVKHNFHEYLRHGKPALGKQIQAFVSALPEFPHGFIDATKVLADVVESTVGAIHTDSNESMDTTWEVVKGILDPTICPEMLQSNPMKLLYELCKNHGLGVEIKDEEGTCEVFIDNQLRGRCKYSANNTEVAINRAADDAYKEMVILLHKEEPKREGTHDHISSQ